MGEIENWHRHFGVYGICTREDKLLVIYKDGGPYTGRYDLPGGSFEKNETINDCIVREFIEETGITIKLENSIGVVDLVVPYVYKEYSHIHHVALMYTTCHLCGDIEDAPNIDDSMGATWVSLDHINASNSSPLIIEAKNYLLHGEMTLGCTKYETWTKNEPFMRCKHK